MHANGGKKRILSLRVYCEKTRIHGKVPAQTLGRQSQTGRVNRVAQLFTEIGKKEVRRNSHGQVPLHMSRDTKNLPRLSGLGRSVVNGKVKNTETLAFNKIVTGRTWHNFIVRLHPSRNEQMLAEITQSNGNFWKGRTEHTDSVPRGMRAA